jgi:hypothetical protein
MQAHGQGGYAISCLHGDATLDKLLNSPSILRLPLKLKHQAKTLLQPNLELSFLKVFSVTDIIVYMYRLITVRSSSRATETTSCPHLRL